MKIAPPAALKPLDLSRKPHGPTRQLTPHDLSPEARLIKPAPTQHERIQKQTEKWVAQTFFGTLLKQMDDSPFKSDLFSGGRGGQAFSSLYHQQLADRVARGAGHKLVNSIVRRIEAKQAYQKQQTAAATGAVPATPPADAGAALKRHEGRFHGRRHVAAAPRA
jgi:Rod binding domain-containing protein